MSLIDNTHRIRGKGEERKRGGRVGSLSFTTFNEKTRGGKSIVENAGKTAAKLTADRRTELR